MMYSNVQMSSDPMMPIGMSRCGFFASCAAVLTASNPMYAKKTIAAPVKTPLQPNSPATGTPSLTVCGGMNGPADPGPADRDGDGAQRVFEHKVPPDDPGDQLAERRVPVRVSAPRHGHEGGELGVAQRGEDGGDPGEDERQHDRRTGV